MKSIVVAAAVIALVGLAGCDKKSQLVGSWKAEPAPMSSNNPTDAARGAMMNLWTQNMKVEFTKEDKVRFTGMQGEASGTYELKGNEVTITFNTLSPWNTLKMKLEGGKLKQATDFESEVGLVLVRE